MAEQPFCRIPNWLVDTVLPGLNGGQAKALVFLWRKIHGWRKASDCVSLTQVQRGAGLSRDSAVRALRGLKKLGILSSRGKSGLRGTVRYQLVTDPTEDRLTGWKNKLVRKSHQSKNHYSTSPKTTTPLVRKSDTQKKLEEKTLREKKGGRAQAPSLPDWIPPEAWNSWKEMRKKLRKPWTEAAERLAVKKLEKLRGEGHDPREVLEQSVLNGWQGLFPVKAETAANGRRNPESWVGRGPEPEGESEMDRVIREFRAGTLEHNEANVFWMKQLLHNERPGADPEKMKAVRDWLAAEAAEAV